jgi:cytidylate kinase
MTVAPKETERKVLPTVIAIDGPAGAGKSTVARRVALALACDYLDTGAMYRAVAYQSLREGISETDEAALADIARRLVLRFGPLAPDGTQRVFVNNEDVTEAIRTPDVSRLVSPVSAHSAVRRELVAQQRALGRQAESAVVLEGRDIGTVVFPDADLKIFLTASPEERARRRLVELQERGHTADFETVLAEQNVRDTRDSQRADSPLKPAPDAIELLTDGLTIEQVVAEIVRLVQTRQKPA